MIEHRSMISFDGKEGLKLIPSSPWVSFAPKEVKEAAADAMYAEWDHFCAVRLSTDE